MPEATKSNDDDDNIDIAALQAQLRAERETLAQEIGARLSSLSPQKGDYSSSSIAQRRRHNPFAMPGNAAVASSSSSASASPFAFQHRPANLGLGAEQDAAQMLQSGHDRRLKGALLAGKRKRLGGGISGDDDSEMQAHVAQPSVDTDSKSAVIAAHASGKGKGTGTVHDEQTANGKQRKIDPFARKKKNKGAAGKGDRVANDESSTRPAETSPIGQAPMVMNGAAAPLDMQSLSKSARKKLKKKMRLQDQVAAAGVKEEQGASRQNAGVPASRKRKDDESSNGDNNHAASRHEQSDLTPAQRAMQSQLSGARFRRINETLYTTSSDEAVRLVHDEPELLQDYHAGFREQVKGWPQVPVRQIFDELVAAQMDTTSSGKGNGSGKQTNQAKGAIHAVESRGRCTPGALVADLGAGDGFLAKWVATSKALSSLSSPARILSYDLLDSADGWVRGVDIARAGALPLPGRALGSAGQGDSSAGSDSGNDDVTRCVDVAIFCLALMATNWLESILEASRVLRPGGELLIAEVASRLTDRPGFLAAVEACGFKCTREDTSNTHFVRFDFVKKRSDQWRVPFTSAAQRTAFVDGGAALLKPCIYKRR